MVHSPPIPSPWSDYHNIWWGEQLMNILTVQFSTPPISFSVFSTNTVFNTPCSLTPLICSSHWQQDQVSNPYKTEDENVVLHTWIFMFPDRRQKDKRPKLYSSKHLQSLIGSASSWMWFWLVTVGPQSVLLGSWNCTFLLEEICICDLTNRSYQIHASLSPASLYGQSLVSHR